MKKIIATLMIIVLTMLSGMTVFALTNSVFEENSGIQLDYGDVPEINMYLDNRKIDENLVGTRSTFTISLPILPFDQKDEDWDEEIMETCHTFIKDEGCALTCVAMVFKYYGANTNPLILNNDLGNDACPIYWSKAADVGSDGNASLSVYRESPTNNEVMNTCVLALEEGHPVIIGFINPNDIEDTHFVLVKSLIGSGTSWLNYGVIDPNGGGTSNLQNYLNQGYDFHRIVVYDKL